MARGAPPCEGFQLSLPDSAQFSSPDDKAQNGQQNNSGAEYNAQQHSAQQRQTQHRPQAADTQNVTPPGVGTDQQQRTQAANGMAHYPQQAMTPSGSHRNDDQVIQDHGVMNQMVVQPTHGQIPMVPTTPGGYNQQHQAMMSSNLGPSQQTGQGINGNNYQQPQAFNFQGIAGQVTPGYQRNQGLMAQSPMAGQQMHFTPTAMNHNTYNPLTGLGHIPDNFQHMQTAIGNNNMVSPGSATAPQYGQSFMANDNVHHLSQSTMGNPLFPQQQQQQGLMMPDNFAFQQPSTGYMPNNNMDGQQSNMALMPGTGQFQQPPEFQNAIQEMDAQRLQMQMVNQLNQMQQQQPVALMRIPALTQNSNGQLYTGNLMNQPGLVPNQGGNQNANGSMEV